MSALLVVSLTGAASTSTGPLTGRATIIDGDTLEIGQQRVRLFGIDAPEESQLCRDVACKPYRCGQQAANALAELIGASPLSCASKDIDRYGRVVAVCWLGGVDINAWLVERGYAVAYRHYSTVYVAKEDEARSTQRGLWAGTFTPPWLWRQREWMRKHDRNELPPVPNYEVGCCAPCHDG